SKIARPVPSVACAVHTTRCPFLLCPPTQQLERFIVATTGLRTVATAASRLLKPATRIFVATNFWPVLHGRTVSKNVTIAIDAMSGDRGAAVVVHAALEAVRENEALSLVLVGIRSELEALLHGGHPRIRIVEVADVVRMNERPSHALRHKRNSSMAITLGLVRDGEAQGCVSAGNTGALMAFGRSLIRMYPGIERPAIAKLI